MSEIIVAYWSGSREKLADCKESSVCRNESKLARIQIFAGKYAK